MKLILSLLLSFYFLACDAVSSASGMTVDEVWDACWSTDHALILRNINYPNPMHLVFHNISLEDWNICVFDKLCEYTMYRGLLRHNHSITLSACADKWGRGSVTVMNADGEMWQFNETGDRIIYIEK